MNTKQEGFSSDDITRAFSEAVATEISENKKQGFPIARYDKTEQRAYLENADG